MSRSNPTLNSPNPCQRWFEWDGQNGCITWYDKAKKEQFEHPPELVFVPLDRLAKIHGYHKRSKSSIYSNEVRNTTEQPLIVKAFKGGPIAEGFYTAIKDRVNAAGASYCISLYAGYRPDKSDKNPRPALTLCNFRLSGAARSAWMDFEKEVGRDAPFQKAVKLYGYKDGTSGSIKFRAPLFKLVEVSEETDAEAKALDAEVLQPFLENYFKRPTTARAEPPQGAPEPDQPEPGQEPDPEVPEEDDSEVPF